MRSKSLSCTKIKIKMYRICKARKYYQRIYKNSLLTIKNSIYICDLKRTLKDC